MFLPVLVLAIAPPLFMMGGVPRPIVGGALVVAGVWMLVARHRQGWALEAPEDHEVHLEET